MIGMTPITVSASCSYKEPAPQLSGTLKLLGTGKSHQSVRLRDVPSNPFATLIAFCK